MEEKPKFRAEGKYLVLAEGTNDCFVMDALSKHHQLSDEIKFYDCGSDQQALKKLQDILYKRKSERPDVLGIVLDADNPDHLDRWNQIADQLREENYDVPAWPDEDGTIISHDNLPTIGIWLFPNNQTDGMLEDFLKEISCSQAIQCATECVQKADEQGHTNFRPNHYPKAIVRTLLSWQDKPSMFFGKAIENGVFDANHELAEKFVKFLRKLFPA